MLTPNSRDPGAGLGHKVHAANFWRENSARCVRLETGGAWPETQTPGSGAGGVKYYVCPSLNTPHTGLALEANIYVHFFSYARKIFSFLFEGGIRPLACVK